MQLKQRSPRSQRPPRSRSGPRHRLRPDPAHDAPVELSARDAPVALDSTSSREVPFYERVGKRLLDLLLLSGIVPVAVIFALPVALWNACEFRSLRQILFLQERVGLRGRTFWIYKFRTMREPTRGGSEPWTIESDVLRTTRFGRFLRNTHLDELPQLVNVLKGDMHLVGPRPEMVEVHRWACKNVAGFARRVSTPPGLTGLAQITQGYTVREADSYAAKLTIDLEYIRGTSLRQDLCVLLRTIPWVLQGRGWSWQSSSRRS